MAHLSLSRQFLKEVWLVLRRRSLKELMFGKKVGLSGRAAALLMRLEANRASLGKAGRSGEFVKLDPVHKASGRVFLVTNQLGKPSISLLLFSSDTKIVSGPDLWVYLSSEVSPRSGLGEIVNLGLLKGTVGSQLYEIPKSLSQLKRYRSVAIYCQQFKVLFSFARLT